MSSDHHYYTQSEREGRHSSENMNQGRQVATGGYGMETSASAQSHLSTGSSWISDPASPVFDVSRSPTAYDWSPNTTPIPEFGQPSISDLPSTTVYRSKSFRSSRPTPNSLGWTHTKWLKLYNFIVPKGAREPYFILREDAGATPTDMTPQRVYLDQYQHNDKKTFPCMFPGGCKKKDNACKRPADLVRHYKNVHASLDQKDLFLCDYEKCGRSEGPFTRKDHYRDHLKDYHREDLGCAKGQKKLSRDIWNAAQEQWLSERVIYPGYWRCSRCLDRIYVAIGGWECPRCKTTCEVERIDARKKLQLRPKTMKSHKSNQSGSCITCDGQGWVDSYQGQIDCPKCTAPPNDEPRHHGPRLAASHTFYEQEEKVDRNFDLLVSCMICNGQGFVDDEYGNYVACAQCQVHAVDRPYHTDHYTNDRWV